MTLSEHTDHALLDLARQGDDDAFGELVGRHYRRCLELATLFVGNYWDAEDQVQIACSKAHIHIHQFQGKAEFPTWLSRIVINQCLMSMRERRKMRFVYLDDTWREGEARPLDMPACGPDPEGEVAIDELKQVLRTEMRRLPSMMRDVVVLRDIQELPIADVADALQISVAAAKSRLLRGRTELRRRLKRRCENMGTMSPVSRAAAPLSRVAHAGPMHPRLAAEE